MNKEQFTELIKKLQSPMNQQERTQVEQIYYQLRDTNPSDNFVELMFNEIITPSSIQGFCQILFRQDIDTNGNLCALKRSQNDRQVIITILSYMAQNPSLLLAQFVGAYALLEITNQRPIQEVFDYIEQGHNSNNTEIQLNVLSLVSLLAISGANAFPFNLLEFLQQSLSNPVDAIATNAISCLLSLLTSDLVKVEKLLTNQVKTQICMAVLQRVVQTLQNNNQAQAEKQLKAFCQIVGQQADHLVNQFTDVIALLKQIVLAEVSEKIKTEAIYIFENICGATDQMKKKLTGQVLDFVQCCVIPNLVMSDADFNNWANQEEYDFEDDSIRAACENCSETVSQKIGKQIILSLYTDLFNGESIQQKFIALDFLRFTLEGIAHVLKKSEIKVLVEKVIALTLDENPRIRYDALDCIGQMTDDIGEVLNEFHQQIMGSCFQRVNDQNVLVQRHALIVIAQVIDLFEQNELYEHKDQLIILTENLFVQEDMKKKTAGVKLLSQLCEGLDESDLLSTLSKLVPDVLQQFFKAVQIIQQNELLKEQTDYLEGILDCIKQAIDAVPHMFAGIVDDIMSNLIQVLVYSESMVYYGCYLSAMQCTFKISEHFETQKYVEQVYKILIKTLNNQCITSSSKPEEEGETFLDKNQVAMQTQALITLSQLIDKYPQCFGLYLTEIYKTLKDFICVDVDDQTASKLDCICELLKVPDACNMEFEPVHKQLMPDLIKYTNIKLDDDTYLSLKNIGDQAESVQIYVKAYYSHYKIHGESSFEQTVNEFFNILEQLWINIGQMFKQEFEEIEQDDELDQEEALAHFEGLYQEHKEAVDAIGGCLSAIIVSAGTSDINMSSRVIGLCMKFLELGTASTPGITATIEAFGIFGDIFIHSEQNQANTLMQSIYPGLTSIILNQTDDFDLLNAAYLSLSHYLLRSRSALAANNGDLLNKSVEYLNNLKEFGREETEQLFDQIVNYLVISGDILNQNEDYWKALLNYAKEMKSDPQIIADTVSFVSGLQFSQETTQLQVACLSQLLFGNYYNNIVKNAENQQILISIRDLLKQHHLIVQNTIQNMGEYAQKNATGFFM
ncbi:Importin_beta-3 subunit [Hexamita inflata]|uniref:Importin beta-3 subunit n=1 Tax=Hexamita inflata TaxID=28002 RepID=A0AA86U6L9_9EUKA|nr:Importin beta-3 subunit [Hexamita inflata]